MPGRHLLVPAALAVWVLLTYGFRLVTAARDGVWTSVTAGVVLSLLALAVLVLLARAYAGRPVTATPVVLRVLAGLAAGWSGYRAGTTLAGDHGAAFVAGHLLLAAVTFLLAAAAWRTADRWRALSSGRSRRPAAGTATR